MSVDPTDLELEHDGLDLALKVDRRHLPVSKIDLIPAQDYGHLKTSEDNNVSSRAVVSQMQWPDSR